jgi:hypothetical protein
MMPLTAVPEIRAIFAAILRTLFVVCNEAGGLISGTKPVAAG